LRTIGWKAIGFISAEDLVPAGRAETGAHNYDQVILATGTWLAPGWRAFCAETRFIGCVGAGATVDRISARPGCAQPMPWF
jgi:hypothetical protein